MLGCKGFEPVRLHDRSPFAVRRLLMLFVMPMIWVYNVLQFTDLVLQMCGFNLGIM
jgi:hypothetical protein